MGIASPLGKIAPWSDSGDIGSESQLVEKAVAGDMNAFRALSEIHRPGLYKIARRYVKNCEDVNDVVQETIYKALKSLNDFEIGRPFKPWIYRICLNFCLDLARYRQKAPCALTDEAGSIPDATVVDEQASNNILRTQILDAISRLPGRYRSIVVMRFFRHMDVSEIAVALKAPEGTIKSWLFRARAKLRDDLRLQFS